MKPREKATLLIGLYFAQGLPFGFFVQAVPVFLRTENLSLSIVGASYLLLLPWALKFLWAPLSDSQFNLRFGRRKIWILTNQIISVLLLVLLSFMPLEASALAWLAASFVLINFLAASQDVGTDGLAIDILEPSERGWANGIQVAGYRLGMITGGGAILIVYDKLGWQASFITMALLSFIATLPLMRFTEPIRQKRDLFHPFSFLTINGSKSWIVIVFLYKIGDEMARGMLRPLLVDRGLTMSDIGWLLGTASFASGLVGALLGGYLAGRSKRQDRGLIYFSALQALGAFSYLALTILPFSVTNAYLVCSFDHLVGGMATACLFTLMMDAVNPLRAASDYTFQACVVVIATAVGSAASGLVAQNFGYTNHFLFSALFCVFSTIVCVMMLRMKKVRLLLTGSTIS